MKECERHASTLAQAVAGRPDAHVAECERCGDTRAVVDALAHLSADANRLRAPAADARVLFLRSRFVARLQGEQRRAERSERPLVFARVAALAVMAGVIGWTLLGGTAVATTAAAPSSAAEVLYTLSRLAAWPLAVGAFAAIATGRFLWVED
jgi:hypothetical protein